VNLSSSLKIVATKEYQLTKKQRFMVIAGIVMIAILITIYMSQSEVAVEPTVPINQAQQLTAITNKGVIPMGDQVNQTNQTKRDPFSQLPNIKEEKRQTDPNVPIVQNNVLRNLPGNVPPMVQKQVGVSTSTPQENVKLTGIVSTADQAVAVIMVANKSKVYKVNDFVGGYRLTDISQDAIILTDGNRTQVLHLESTGQKGGINGGK